MNFSENLDFQPSKTVNIANELFQIIKSTKKYAKRGKISEEKWNNFILSQEVKYPIHEDLCVVPRNKIPWEWRQDEDGRITIYLHYVNPSHVSVTETTIRSPKLYGELWYPVTDIEIKFNEESSSTIVSFTPKGKKVFPVIVRRGLQQVDDSDKNYIVYSKTREESDPRMDPHSMFFLGMFSILFSKELFFEWESIAAYQGEPNAMSYLARVCLGDENIPEATYWFAKLTLEHNHKPSTVDLSLILIKKCVKPLLAENLLCGLCKEGYANLGNLYSIGITNLGKLYLEGCDEKNKEIGPSDSNANEENAETIERNPLSVAKNVEKGLKLLKMAVEVDSNNEEAVAILDKYNKDHPFGEYSTTDVAISAGIVVSFAFGAFWIMKRLISSRKK